MKRVMTLCVLVLTLTMALCPAALAADLGSAATAAQVCYPTSISRSEDGTELKKIYDLGPEDDPAGIPRSDFEQDGFHYTLTDLLKQELPENESRQHTETVSLPSKNKDMESVLALLPAEKEFVTDDGLTGILSLDLSTVRVEVAGYGSSTKEVSATRSYPNLAGQDTQYIPKTIEEDGRTLTLQTVNAGGLTHQVFEFVLKTECIFHVHSAYLLERHQTTINTKSASPLLQSYCIHTRLSLNCWLNRSLTVSK